MKIKARNSAGVRSKSVAATDSGSTVIDQHALEKDVLEQRLLATAGERPEEKDRTSGAFSGGVVVLLLLLMLQLLYLYREQAVEIDFIASVSRSLGYTPPQIRHPEMIGLTNRVFTHVEGQEGLYRLQLGVMNHTSHRQPFPLIEVSLTDAQGVTRARNRFHALDYLSPAVVRDQMTPDEEYVVSFAMKSSASDISGFMLDFF